MPRILAIFLIFFVFLSANTQSEIEKKSKFLNKSKELEISLGKKLDELAKDILKGEKEIKNIDKEIQKLQNQVDELKDKANSVSKELVVLNKQNGDLIETKQNIENAMIRIISENFALDLVLESKDFKSAQSVVSKEIVEQLNANSKLKFKELAKNYENTLNLINNQNSKISSIQNSLKEYENKKVKLSEIRKKQSKILERNKDDKAIYMNRISRLQKQQIEIQQTLNKLKILSIKEQEKKVEKKSSVKVVGSSYQKSNVKRYIGQKTIAPLEKFSVKQKFGNYIDPIYNIKIFNESVVLKSNEQNAKVRSVLSGKVVFARQTNMLDNVVIVENANGIHTIYANLEQIVPTIKVGSKIIKGYTIGRIRDELRFEVTQKNYHIDPLELIVMQ